MLLHCPQIHLVLEAFESKGDDGSAEMGWAKAVGANVAHSVHFT